MKCFLWWKIIDILRFVELLFISRVRVRGEGRRGRLLHLYFLWWNVIDIFTSVPVVILYLLLGLLRLSSNSKCFKFCLQIKIFLLALPSLQLVLLIVVLYTGEARCMWVSVVLVVRVGVWC
jgi:hypothetical protein